MCETEENPEIPSTPCVPHFKQQQNPDFCLENPFFGKLLSNKRLTASDWEQDVREYRIELHPSMHFTPGDALAILPSNPPGITTQFLQRVNISPNLIIKSIQARDECSFSLILFYITLNLMFEIALIFL